MHHVIGPLLASFTFGGTAWLIIGNWIVALVVWIITFAGAIIGRGRL